MKWKIISTNTFSNEFKKYKKNKEFVNAMAKKIKKLQDDPKNIGGYLSGNLHGYKSTRIIGKFRIIYKVIEEKQEVQLSAIDHRKFDYKRFNLK